MAPLLKAFQVPSYLSLPAAAFDLSDRTIKYMEVRHEPGVGILPAVYEERKIKKGIIISGDVQDVEALVLELKSFKKRYKKTSFVNIALPEELAFVFDFDIRRSDIESGDLRQYIEFKLPEFIPFSVQNALFDFDVILETDKYLHVSVVVYPQDIVEEYLMAFEEAGYTVKSAELETVAIARSVVPGEYLQSTKSLMVLDVGTSKIGVTIMVGSAPVFSTAISFPMKSKFEELFKVQFGRKPTDDNELFEWKFKEGILFLPPDSLNKFEKKVINEIVKIKDYFNSHKSPFFEELSHVYLSGGNAATKGMDALLESSLSVECTIGNVWQNMFNIEKYIPEINKRESLKYATLSGLVLKDKHYE